MRSHDEARTELEARLKMEGWNVAPNALEPLRKIDFAKLVSIYDHEERFLEQTFIHTLIGLPRARPLTASQQEINASDVKTALLMLGVAIERQAEETVSAASKNVIKDACGFC